MSRFYDDDSQPLLLYGPDQKLGQIAEGNSLSKKEQTDEIEQQMRMNKQ